MEDLISSPRGNQTGLAFGTVACLPRALVFPAILVLLSACQPAEESQPLAEPIRPVRFVTVEELPGGETVTLTGNVQAQDDVALAFRVGGQLVERTVSVGDQVRTGQVVARLDAVNERNAIDAARANLAAILAERVSGSLFPGLAGVVEVWLWPVPGLLLDTTFVQVPLLHVRDAFRDRRSVGRRWPLWFAQTLRTPVRRCRIVG